MKLYYVPHTRSTRPRWVLEELGLPCELVRLDPSKGETRTAEHLARQPLGHVPVLQDGELRLFESAAICLYLAERYGEGRLLPPAGAPARGLAYQWMFFAVTEIEAALNTLAGAVWKKPETEWDQPLVARAKGQAAKALAVVDAALAGREFILDAFSVPDVLLGSLTSYAKMLGVPVPGEHLGPYVARLKARPAYRRATAD